MGGSDPGVGMAGERGSDNRAADYWSEDLLAYLRELEARNRELAAALALAQRELVFYRLYHARVQEAMSQALEGSFQSGSSQEELPRPGRVTHFPEPTLPGTHPFRPAAERTPIHPSTDGDVVSAADVAALARGLSALREQFEDHLHEDPPPAAADATARPTARPAAAEPPPRSLATETFGPDSLTPREVDVLRLMAQGLGNREIASRLVISEKTVKSHVTAIFSKLGVTDRTQAVLYAVRKGLT